MLDASSTDMIATVGYSSVLVSRYNQGYEKPRRPKPPDTRADEQVLKRMQVEISPCGRGAYAVVRSGEGR